MKNNNVSEIPMILLLYILAKLVALKQRLVCKITKPRKFLSSQNNQQGFTLIEVILFIIITGLLASTLLLSFYTSLQKMPALHQNMIATQTARRCMDWIIGQRRMNGFSTITCPSTTTPTFCTAPSGYTISTNITCTTINSDTNYKTITITISGAGDAKLSTLLANY